MNSLLLIVVLVLVFYFRVRPPIVKTSAIWGTGNVWYVFGLEIREIYSPERTLLNRLTCDLEDIFRFEPQRFRGLSFILERTWFYIYLHLQVGQYPQFDLNMWHKPAPFNKLWFDGYSTRIKVGRYFSVHEKNIIRSDYTTAVRDLSSRISRLFHKAANFLWVKRERDKIVMDWVMNRINCLDYKNSENIDVWGGKRQIGPFLFSMWGMFNFSTGQCEDGASLKLLGCKLFWNVVN